MASRGESETKTTRGESNIIIIPLDTLDLYKIFKFEMDSYVRYVVWMTCEMGIGDDIWVGLTRFGWDD
jgi:hypothetical protein